MHMHRVITTCALVGSIGIFGALYGMFYYAPQDMGAEPVIEIGSVRGASAMRFQLPQEEIFLSSLRGQKPYDTDVLILSRVQGEESSRAYIVRNDTELLFSQLVSSAFTRISWVLSTGFLLTNQEAGTSIIFSASDTGYRITTQ